MMIDLHEEADELLRKVLHRFADWMEKEWPFEEGEGAWKKAFAEEYPGDKWIDAYNAGIRSVQGALTLFLDEMGY